MQISYTSIDLPTGLAFAASTPDGIARLSLRVPSFAEFFDELAAGFGTSPVEDDRPFRTLRRELKSYFAGEPVAFTTPIDLRGTEFQLKVWRALMAVPHGSVRSYGWLAEAAGKPGAARAVGGALHKNKVAILVPCHRIVESSGGLGGFGCGPGVKRRLLEIEGALPTLSSPAPA